MGSRYKTMLNSLKQIIQVLWFYGLAKCRMPQWTSRKHVETYQKQRLAKQLQWVNKHSSFYKKRWQRVDTVGSLSVNDLQVLPIIDKHHMMTHFDTLNTSGISKEDAFNVALKAEKTRQFSPMLGEVSVGLSSGTSGYRGLFLANASERAKWAGTMLAKVLPKPIWVPQRIALFLRADNSLYQTIQSRTIQFDYYDLTQPFDCLLKKLDSQKPTLLVAPPSVLVLLAQSQQKGLSYLAPEKIISVADVLIENDRQIIEAAFDQQVHQVYQCTEGFLASTCEYGTLHVNEDLVIIEKEWIDEASGRFVPIVTDLYRRTQPIIRYRLNDVLKLRDKKIPCPCGSVMMALDAIEGRCDDVLYFRHQHQDTLISVFPNVISRTVLHASIPINDYSITQVTDDMLEVSLQPLLGVTLTEVHYQTVEQSIDQMCQRLHCQLPHIRFIPFETAPLTQKRRRVQRLAKVNLSTNDKEVVCL